MDFIVGLIVGILVATLISYVLVQFKRTDGTFVMDFTNPMKDVCRIELDKNLNSLYTRKHITLRVKVYEDNSLN